MREDVSALILTGGRATRLGGIAKHELIVEGVTIFERQRRVLEPRVAEIIVSGRGAGGLRAVADHHEGIGPLAGIAAGLAAATTPWLLVVAGDMPYLDPGVIDLLVAATGDAIDGVGVLIDGLPQPLLCVLHARARPVLDHRLATRQYKASALLTDERLRIRWIVEAEVRAIDPQLKSFVNLNEPQDLRPE